MNKVIWYFLLTLLALLIESFFWLYHCCLEVYFWPFTMRSGFLWRRNWAQANSVYVFTPFSHTLCLIVFPTWWPVHFPSSSGWGCESWRWEPPIVCVTKYLYFVLFKNFMSKFWHCWWTSKVNILLFWNSFPPDIDSSYNFQVFQVDNVKYGVWYEHTWFGFHSSIGSWLLSSDSWIPVPFPVLFYPFLGCSL